MSIFDDGSSSGLSKMSEQCKRDWEAEIKRLREKNSASSQLLLTLKYYIQIYKPYGRNNERLSLPEMVGLLVLETEALEREIANAIAQQEKEDK
uniref:Uncharacterized protein n=1 Tax=viral metagenome TaxID=1070528 RepID=A0A6M3JPY6_9ZZZZ